MLSWRDSSIATELAAELTAHKMKLPEEVVEALGEGTPSNAEDCNGKENEKVERIEFSASGEADTHIQAVSPNKRPFEQFVESQVGKCGKRDQHRRKLAYDVALNKY